MKSILILNPIVLPALVVLLSLHRFTLYAQTSNTPPAGLVAWWPGEGNAADIVGTNNGTLENGTSFGTGRVGQTFAFSGASQFVQIPDSPSLEPTNFTLACWFNATNATGSLVQKIFGQGSADSFGLWLQSGGLNGTICSATNGGSRLSVHYDLTPTPGFWYHAALTFDDAAEIETLYLNGKAVASAYTGFQINYDTNAVLIGADSDGGSTVLAFKGEIDETMLFDRVLSTNEIQAIYTAGIPQPPPLGVASTGNQTILFWPVSPNTYTLQSTTNLTSPNWITATDAMPVTAFTVSNTAPARFFRLLAH